MKEIYFAMAVGELIGVSIGGGLGIAGLATIPLGIGAGIVIGAGIGAAFVVANERE
ncbi:hypothetical protein [Phyllobacterium sp. OV277]|uniref:hypothetical protein n=1 Tax=Phyllobacterium sp. OV277 TaxID=1882772 RepID=UPI0008816EC9|nr:hypothetical protein [Phyllobacterium sp. OV277]SDP36901.1 hypothetical protein SAMN05443582_104355 [Phyllobacterium sp. OV277]